MLKRVAITAVALYAGSLVWRGINPQPRAPRPPLSDPGFVPRTAGQRREVFDRIAAKYDRYVSIDEMGAIHVHRKRLCSYAKEKGEAERERQRDGSIRGNRAVAPSHCSFPFPRSFVRAVPSLQCSRSAWEQGAT